MDFAGQNTLATWDFTAAFNATADYQWMDRNDLYVKNNSYYFQARSARLLAFDTPVMNGDAAG